MTTTPTDAASPEEFALSAQQRRIWSEGAAACVQAALAIDGPLDRDRLRRALERVVERHAALRTTFRAVAGLRFPLQVVHAALAPAWQVSAPGTGPAFDDLCAAERRPFDPAGSPVRAHLFELGRDHHALIVTAAALCADRATLAIVAADLASAYAGDAVDPTDAGVDYLQLAAWQDALLDGDDAGAAMAFWADQVDRAGAAEPLVLDRPAGRCGERRAIRRVLDPAARARVAGVAAGCGVAVRAVVLAAFHRVLARFTASGPAACWVTLDPRDGEVLSRLCGAAEHDVPLAPGAGDGPLAGHAVQIEAALRAAGDHLAFYRPDREARLACPRLAIGFHHADDSALAPRGAGDAVFRLLHAEGRRAADLTMTCGDTGRELVLVCSHDPGRHAPALAAALLDGLAAALEGATADARPSEPPLPAGAAAPVVSAAQPPTGVIHQRFAEQVARTPDRLAVVCDRFQLTFAELARRAAGIAAALAARGVRRGEPVAIYLERSSHLIAAILGVLEAGAAYAPIHPSAPAERVRATLDAAGIRMVLTGAGVPAAALAGRDRIEVDGALPPAAGGGSRLPASPGDLAYVIHTSGSTGVPKGVEVHHGAVINLLHALRARIHGAPGEPRRVSLNAPIAFDSSVKQWIQLLDGHTICVVPEDRRLDPAALWSFAVEHRIDVLDCTPSQLRLLLASGAFTGPGGPTTVLVGGEAIDPALWEAMAARPDVAFHNVYGPTECTVDATSARVAPGTPTLGAALDHCSVYVLDEQLRPLPVGAPGEICIGGAGVARGYRRNPAATAERFVPDRFAAAPGARFYRTGDRAYRDERGELVFLGRTDNQVKLRGHRIELDEIAAVLCGIDEVRAAAAAVLPGRSGAPGDARLVAYVVPRAGAEPGRDALRAHLRERLPEVMVPEAFVLVPELPLSANGKLARDRLPDPDDASPGDSSAAPALDGRTAVQIAQIWQDVLGVSKVGLHDNFFDLGGHSLRMVEVRARLCAAFGRDIPMVDMFRHPTVAALARYVDLPPADAPAERPVPERASRRRAAVASRANHKRRRGT